MNDCFLTDFKIVKPKHRAPQDKALEWLVNAHTKAEQKKSDHPMESDYITLFRNQLKDKLWHVGCKPDTIAFRGHSLEDFLHEDWHKMRIYNLEESPEGAGMRARGLVYDEITHAVVEQFYPNDQTPPDDFIHVSCTGYSAPSVLQKMISARGWGAHTTVTHAYHMGCYASLPAVRMARGFLAVQKKKVDIVHTELCTLHNNPSNHAMDQLVAHSLFADGFIRYSAESKQASEPAIRVLAVHEEIIPNSLNAMLWSLGEWGFEFTLSREIPVLIMRALQTYFTHLCAKAEVNEKEILGNALFALHPGGPKILKYVQENLGLQDAQVSYSHAILREHGNMSSATLPHVWKAILDDPKVPRGTKIISLAFGPGLTIAGAVMEKEG